MRYSMNIEKEMFDNAIDLLNKRCGDDYGCVAVVRIETGEYLTGLLFESNISSTDLCAETGPILEAHKLNKKVTHSICVYQNKEGKNHKILAPCGVCQERLRFWGKDVKAAITSKEGKIIFKTLDEISPYYWLDK